MVNAYRKIFISKFELSVSGVPLKGKAVLKNCSLIKNQDLIILGLAMIKNLLELIRVKNEDLNIYNFQLKYLSPLLTFNWQGLKYITEGI